MRVLDANGVEIVAGHRVTVKDTDHGYVFEITEPVSHVAPRVRVSLDDGTEVDFISSAAMDWVCKEVLVHVG